MKCAFIFRRDLRTRDNTGLMRASQECEEVVPTFILDPRQLENNPYRSEFAVNFMLDSLTYLDEELRELGSKLHVLRGVAEEVVAHMDVDRVYVNEDYTPFSIRRDVEMSKVKPMTSTEDLLLTPKESFLKNGKPYSVFTRFYLDVKGIPVRRPLGTPKGLVEDHYPGVETLPRGEPSMAREWRDYLERASRTDYSKRNYPYLDTTTRLSPFLKFGVVSVREVYHAVGEQIRRQLYWRDFYTLLAYYNPHVFSGAYKREFDQVKWENDPEKFKLWCQGMTGFPFVDAGMRELNSTGFMHNRTRMVTASFLTKVLHVDWRWGERYFASKLVDYDPSVNNGNWQWVASTGTDYMFRVFNPWLQSKKFDPEAQYVKKWVPELREVPPQVIHEIYKHEVKGYPRPIVNYEEEVRKARVYYGVEGKERPRGASLDSFMDGGE